MAPAPYAAYARSPRWVKRRNTRKEKFHLSSCPNFRDRLLLDLAAEIYHLREPQKLVMSQDETRRLLAVASSLKVRVAAKERCSRSSMVSGHFYFR